jgi:HSP20 family protein
MITRYQGFPAFRNAERLAKMFEDLWPEVDETRWANQPKVDILETEKDLTFVLDLPGIDEKDIDVEVVGDRLTVRAHRETEKEEKRDNYVRMERSFGTYQRSFSLDFPVAPNKVDARYEKGVLHVCVPKAENAKAHHVPVKKIGK